MIRRLLDILAAFALLLLVVILPLWAGSYSVHDILGFAFAGGSGHAVHSVLGRLYLKTDFDGGYPPGLWHSIDSVSGPAGPGTNPDGLSSYDLQARTWCGFSWKTYSSTHVAPGVGPFPTTHHRLIAVPYWFLAAVLGIAACLWVRWLRQRVRRRFRLALGLCLACGYNLTGNVSGICPECGTPTIRPSEVRP